MYPQPGLKRLGAYKTRLRERIAARRAECVAAATGAARPLAWIDRLIALGRRLAPLASLPLGLVVARVAFPRRNLVGSLLRGAPLLATAAWMLRGAFSRSPVQSNPPL